MAARSTRFTTNIKLWIPPSTNTIYKFEIINKDGTTTDLSLIADIIEIEDGVTDRIGRFRFEVYNSDNSYTNKWIGNETVKYYSDYAATATTKRFQGKVEKVVYTDNKVIVSGRSESLFFFDKTVTASFSKTDCSDILKSLNETYSDGTFTVNNIETSNVELTVEWQQKPFWEVVQELCQAAAFDCYIDSDKDWHFFAVNSRTNNGEGIMYNYNLLYVNDSGSDIQQVKNRIIVYGATVDGVQIIDSAEDLTSQQLYGVREEIISNDNIIDQQQAKDLANFRLDKYSNPTLIGEVTGLLLASVQPGQKIHIGSPDNNITRGTYKVSSYVHKINVSQGFTTVVRINNEPRRLSSLLKNMVETSSGLKNTNLNPYEMRHSYNELFNDQTGTLKNLEITDGILKLQSGQSTGTWISDLKIADNNLTEVYLLSNGSVISGASYGISVDNGVSPYININRGERVILFNTGKNIRIKVTITNANTEIDSLSLLYK